MLIIALSSCATTDSPDIDYNYTAQGIEITSDPPGANVTITITSMALGKSSSKTLNYVTPYYNPNDQFVTYATTQNFEIKMKYYFEVEKPGYETLTLAVDGQKMKSVWHFKLNPIGERFPERRLER